MKTKLTLLTACIALAGCTTIDLGADGKVRTIGGKRALEGLTYENTATGTKLSVKSYQSDQSKDFQKAMDLLAEAMAILAKGAVMP